MRWVRTCCAAVAVVGLVAAILPAQTPAPPPKQRFVWPETMRNPQVLPRDIGSQRLRETMIGFVNALGVRCSHCHVGSEDIPLPERDLAADGNPRKQVAREMMRLVQHLNQERLPAISGLSEPRVTCYTCHRGATTPAVSPPPESPS